MFVPQASSALSGTLCLLLCTAHSLSLQSQQLRKDMPTSHNFIYWFQFSACLLGDYLFAYCLFLPSKHLLPEGKPLSVSLIVKSAQSLTQCLAQKDIAVEWINPSINSTPRNKHTMGHTKPPPPTHTHTKGHQKISFHTNQGMPSYSFEGPAPRGHRQNQSGQDHSGFGQRQVCSVPVVGTVSLLPSC